MSIPGGIQGMSPALGVAWVWGRAAVAPLLPRGKVKGWVLMPRWDFGVAAGLEGVGELAGAQP